MTEKTVVIGGATAPSKPETRFPCMRWDPKTGQGKVCNVPGDIPPGWINRHPKDPKYIAEQAAKAAPVAPKAAAPVADKKRVGVIAELKRRKVQFDANESTDVLYAQLLEEVEKEA